MKPDWLTDWLIEGGMAVTVAKQFAEPLKASMALHDISTPKRQAGFIAQAWIESDGFTALEENLRYSDPVRIARIFKTGFDLDRDGIVDPEEVEFAKQYVRQPEKLANRIYANRLGNGNEASGDGWRYRGRGLFQITGKANYIKASIGLGLGAVYVHAPELLAKPTDACMTAAHYWLSNRCNALMDAGDINGCTRAINGAAMLHAKERRERYERLLEAREGVPA